jgi:formylglycine-generating enzyme required for sulfatase activity
MTRGPSALGPPPAGFTVERVGLKLVRLDGATFTMGSPEDEIGRGPEEGPAGEVTVSGPFFMSATEVTNSQFAQVTGRSPAQLAVRASSKISAEMPVESVTWDDTVEFCKKLTDLDRNRRPGWAYRLPTEAEWEYACRAGTTTPFASGEKLMPGVAAVFTPAEADPLAAGELPRPPAMPGRVGQTEANGFGLFDLHGNVWEWCGDWYAKGYPPGPRTDPKGPEIGDLRVVRGGAFNDAAAKCRSASRRGVAPDRRETNIGFRVVFAAEKP